MRSIGFVDLWCSFLSWAHTTQQSLLWFLSFLLLRRTLLILVKKNRRQCFQNVHWCSIFCCCTSAHRGPDRVRGPDEVGDGADFCPGVQFGDGAGIEIWGLGRGREVPTRPAPLPPWLRVLKFSLDNLELDHKRARLLSYIILNLKFKRVKLDCKESIKIMIYYHRLRSD